MRNAMTKTPEATEYVLYDDKKIKGIVADVNRLTGDFYEFKNLYKRRVLIWKAVSVFQSFALLAALAWLL